MKINIIMSVLIIVVLIFTFTNSQPSFNGNTPGCGGSGCHTLTNGIVTAEALDNCK